MAGRRVGPAPTAMRALVALLLAIGLSTFAAAAAPSSGVKKAGGTDGPYADLPRGHGPRVPYVLKRRIRDPQANWQLKSISNPDRYRRVAGGWVLTRTTKEYNSQLVFVQRGEARSSWRLDQRRFTLEFAVSKDGTRFAWFTRTGLDGHRKPEHGMLVLASGQTGRIVAQRPIDSEYGTVAGMLGDWVVFNDEDGDGQAMKIWNPSTGDVSGIDWRLAVATDGVSRIAAQDTGRQCAAVLDTRADEPLLWERCHQHIGGFSTDGSYVLFDSGSTMKFANPSTGDIIKRYPLRFEPWQTRWESDHALLVNARDRGRNAILRFQVDTGTWETATRPRVDPGAGGDLPDPWYNLGTASQW